MDQQDTLRERIRQLEAVEADYRRVQRLVEAASADNLHQYDGEAVLMVSGATGLILSTNHHAGDLLGLPAAQLVGQPLADYEIFSAEGAAAHYIETSVEMAVYECDYRRADGTLAPVRVLRRRLGSEAESDLHYALEDQSLTGRLLRELSRREDNDFLFREKLKAVNEINLELSDAGSVDALCRRAIELGLSRLGFDRLSIWFLEQETGMMAGTYGVDEEGNLRDERDARWSFESTYVQAFIAGKRTPFIKSDQAPIYNERSQVVGRGWHISVPLLYLGDFVGFMAADNFLSQKPMQAYQPELLQIYGTTIGHLASHQRNRERAAQMTDTIRDQRKQLNMLETFIRHLGHDFRTPLTIINTNTYLLNKSQDPERRAKLAQNVQDHVMFLHRMITDISDVITLENLDQLALTRTDLGTLLHHVAEDVTELAAEHQVKLTVSANGAPVIVQVDTTWFRRALLEIIKNAVLYNQEGGEASVSVVEGPDAVEVRVTDTGVGIAPGEIERIFDLLYRADKARTARAVGLGLSIAKRAVEAHGGRIEVQSQPDRGSTFTVVLPR